MVQQESLSFHTTLPPTAGLAGACLGEGRLRAPTCIGVCASSMRGLFCMACPTLVRSFFAGMLSLSSRGEVGLQEAGAEEPALELGNIGVRPS